MCLIINPKQRQLFRLRYGWHDCAGKLRNWQYRLFGDGTDTKHRSLKTILKRQVRKPLTGNAFTIRIKINKLIKFGEVFAVILNIFKLNTKTFHHFRPMRMLFVFMVKILQVLFWFK